MKARLEGNQHNQVLPEAGSQRTLEAVICKVW